MDPNVREEIILKEDLSISITKANIYCTFIALPVVVFLTVLYIWLWGLDQLLNGIEIISQNLPYSFLIVIVGIIVHELLHGLSWAYFEGKSLRIIQFGFQLKTLAPYAHCKVPIDIRAYRIGTAMPGIILGFLPIIIGLVIGNAWSMIFGLLFILIAAGDILLLLLTRKVKVGKLVKDHPTRVGCYVIEYIEHFS